MSTKGNPKTERQAKRQPRGGAKTVGKGNDASAGETTAREWMQSRMGEIEARVAVQLRPLLPRWAELTRQVQAAQGFIRSLSRPAVERAERAERALAEKARVDEERRRVGGQKTAQKRQRKAAKVCKQVVDRWNEMETRGFPERRNRASRIAEELGISVRSARRDLKSAGIGE